MIHNSRTFLTADDFGLDAENNRGIMAAIDGGWLKSVSAMVNMPSSRQATNFLRRHKNLVVGLHFNITEGKPLTTCFTLVNKHGNFYPLWRQAMRLILGRADQQEVAVELKAQYQKLDGAGVKIIHLNSHQHIHLLPSLFALFVRFSVERKKIFWIRQSFYYQNFFWPMRLKKWIVMSLSLWLRRHYPEDVGFWDVGWTAKKRDLQWLVQNPGIEHLEIGTHLALRARRFPEREKELKFWQKVFAHPSREGGL